jgi:hypothetical protein
LADNEWVYWNKMQSLREQGFGVLLPQQNPERQVGAFDSPRLQWNLQGSPQAFDYIYPRRYYDWIQDYLSTAITNKPPANATIRAKIYWSLDVWTHLTYGLLTLGLPLWQYPGKPSQEGTAHGSMQWKGMAAIDQINDRFITALRRYYNGVGNAGDVVGPAPFLEYPFIWNRAFSVGKNIGGSTTGRFGDYVGSWAATSRGRWSIDNAVANTLCWGVVPQMLGGFNVNSWGEKDAFDIQTLTQLGNLPGLMATFQWRIYSIRDWAPKRNTPLPRGMGQWGDGRMVTLSAFVNSHSAKTLQADVFRPAGQTLGSPNFMHAYNRGIVPYIQTLRGVDLQQVDKRAIQTWIDLATPALDSSGNIATNVAKRVRQPDGSLISLQLRQPLTRLDWSELQKGEIKRVKDRSRATAEALSTKEGRAQLLAQECLDNPDAAQCQNICTPAYGDQPEQCYSVQAVMAAGQSYVESMPYYEELMEYSMKFFLWLDSWAVGCSTPPPVRDIDTGDMVAVSGCTTTEQWFFSLPSPFFRSLSPPFSTFADGSSMDVGARVITSIIAAEMMLGWDLGVYGGEWTPERAAAVAAKKPELPAGLQAAYEQQCAADAQAWAQSKPESAACLNVTDWEMVRGACMEVKAGRLSPQAMRAGLDLLVSQRCEAKAGGLWRAFVDGMVESPNPVELLRR